jgi:hypothetical protein
MHEKERKGCIDQDCFANAWIAVDPFDPMDAKAASACRNIGIETA